MKLNLVREIRLEGETPVPQGYGEGWNDWQRGTRVCLPVPLNYVARWVREFLWRMTAPMRVESRSHHEWEQSLRLCHERQRLSEEYARGYITGWQECFQEVNAVIEDELESARCRLGKHRLGSA